MKRFLLTVMMIISTTAAGGQTSGNVVSVSGAAVDSALRELAVNPADFSRELSTGAPNRYQLVVLRKSVATSAEIHERWTDIVFIRGGSAVLQTGEGLVGQKQMARSEWTGSAVKNPRSRSVSAGGIVLIAAGVAHQWKPSGSEPFSYIVVKVRPGRAAP